jgi:hypothetical protein
MLPVPAVLQETIPHVIVFSPDAGLDNKLPSSSLSDPLSKDKDDKVWPDKSTNRFGITPGQTRFAINKYYII